MDITFTLCAPGWEIHRSPFSRLPIQPSGLREDGSMLQSVNPSITDEFENPMILFEISHKK